MKLSRVFMTAVLALAVGGVGCKKKENEGKTKQKPAANTKTNKVTTPAGSDTKTPAGSDTKAPDKTPDKPAANKINVDPTVMSAIKAVASGCEIDVKNMRIKCAKGEYKALEKMYGYTKPKSRVATIGTFAVALGDADAKVRTVAANLLGGKFNYSWGKDAVVGSVNPDVATALLAALPKLGKYQGRRAVNAIAYAATLAKQEGALFKTLDASPDKYVKRKGYEGSMFYGRMSSFPKVAELAKSSDTNERLSAVIAVHKMPKFTDQEKAIVCPWALEQAKFDGDKDESSPVFEYAGYVATRCRGESIDKLLAFGEAQLKKGKFNRQYYFVYRGICFSMVRALLKEPGVKKQCNRNYAFLEKVTNNKKIKPEFRGLALDAISYQRRDAKSLKLMQRYKNHKVADIKKRANDAIKMLKSYVKKK